MCVYALHCLGMPSNRNQPRSLRQMPCGPTHPRERRASGVPEGNLNAHTHTRTLTLICLFFVFTYTYIYTYVYAFSQSTQYMQGGDAPVLNAGKPNPWYEQRVYMCQQLSIY
jgi:hypothetical protein